MGFVTESRIDALVRLVAVPGELVELLGCIPDGRRSNPGGGIILFITSDCCMLLSALNTVLYAAVCGRQKILSQMEPKKML